MTRPLFWISTVCAQQTASITHAIDGLVNGTGLHGRSAAATRVRRIETGNVQHYAFVYLLGVLAIAAYYLYLVTH